MTECSKETNQSNCNCSYTCSKKGMCCECISYHRGRGELPACYFPDDIEKTYDRSINNFIKIKQKKTIKSF